MMIPDIDTESWTLGTGHSTFAPQTPSDLTDSYAIVRAAFTRMWTLVRGSRSRRKEHRGSRKSPRHGRDD